MSREWTDWRWQQRNALRDSTSLQTHLIGPTPSVVPAASVGLRTLVTPYFLDLIRRSGPDADSLINHPLWRQIAPTQPTNGVRRPDDYDGERENWETESEMLTPILHHKYPDRALVRMRNECLSYCTFCLQALRVLDSRRLKVGMSHDVWADTLAALKSRPEVREVILSGGEPLLLGDEQLEAALRDLRTIPSIETIRLHTRALTFNPFRITRSLTATLRRYDVTEIALHVSHPYELSLEFDAALQELSEARALIMAHTPLLKGVNASRSVLEDLFRGLFGRKVKPYYLIHCMPFVPGAADFRTSVGFGAELVRSMKRQISNAAMPEFVIVHESGKKTVPLESDGTREFVYARRSDGWPVIRFLNWKGEQAEYLDSP